MKNKVGSETKYMILPYNQTISDFALRTPEQTTL